MKKRTENNISGFLRSLHDCVHPKCATADNKYLGATGRESIGYVEEVNGPGAAHERPRSARGGNMSFSCTRKEGTKKAPAAKVQTAEGFLVSMTVGKVLFKGSKW